MSFPPTFAFRPLTPPYVPFGIRRFLIFGAFGHSSPLDMGILPCEGWHWMQPISLLGSWLLTNTLCSHFPTYRPSVVRYRTFEGSLPVFGPTFCRRLPSDSVSRRTPLPLAVTFPLSGRFGDFHPLEYVRAGRTKMRLTRKSASKREGKFASITWPTEHGTLLE